MRLSDLEQTDVLKERRLRENRDSMEKPILKIQNLNLYFTQYARGLRRRELHPLRDFSCKLFSGELTAVVGASGSGKSLLAHAILGILPYNCRMEGKISYQGEVLDETRLAGLRGNGISLIPQGVSYLDPLMRVGDQICGGRKDEATRAKCRQLLKRYGLDESVEKCYPFELSGGMARRVLMAAALMQEPRLIVADEPTPGLEAMTARHVIRHLKEMAQDGAAVLLITHDLELAIEMACQRMTEEDMQALEEAQKAFKAAIDQGDAMKIAETDEAYHDVIYHSTRNKRLVQILNNLREQMYRFRLEYIKDEDKRQILQLEHEKILAALRLRHMAEAKAVARGHIDNQEITVLKNLKERKEV